ncbi:MAG: hypothetical protein AB7U98_09655 [Candidatus Nitrosocosmicus sp.]
MFQENTKQYKQVLIDLDNYNTLKDLGKAGDSFNDVITNVLCIIGTKENKSNSVIKKESVIRIYPEDHYFKVLIDSGLRKAGVDYIMGFKEYMNIVFLVDEYKVRIDYPEQLENLSQEVESELLGCDLGLPNYVITRIVRYIQENVTGDIEDSIKQL